jgi:prepilin-type N-terminal cleavage/methylation domain-containing protein
MTMTEKTGQLPRLRTQGYTLIELLVVLVIIGIVASILIGFFVGAYRKTQLRDGAVQLLADMRQTRSQAQRTSQGGTVTLTSTAPTVPSAIYTTVWKDGSATPVTSTRTLPAPVRVAPYTVTTAANKSNVLSYSAPYGDAAAPGIIWEVSSTVISDKLYVKAVGVTGKVILSATPN